MQSSTIPCARNCSLPAAGVARSWIIAVSGFPYKDMQHLDSYLETFKALIIDSAGIRRPGSAALDLAYVAAGRLDGFWEIGLNPWDIAAGVLLVREAGGLVGDFDGGHSFLESGNIVAAAPKLLPAMLREIRPHLGTDS